MSEHLFMVLVFLLMIAFVFGCGHDYGLGEPKKKLPPNGTLLEVEAVAKYVFLANYKGRTICFIKPDISTPLETGLYKVTTNGTGDSRRKILKKVSDGDQSKTQ